jgi:hypothetical protein
MHVSQGCNKFHQVIRLFACYTKKINIWTKNNKDKAHFNLCILYFLYTLHLNICSWNFICVYYKYTSMYILLSDFFSICGNSIFAETIKSSTELGLCNAFSQRCPPICYPRFLRPPIQFENLNVINAPTVVTTQNGGQRSSLALPAGNRLLCRAEGTAESYSSRATGIAGGTAGAVAVCTVARIL